jgi:hypothetical protein
MHRDAEFGEHESRRFGGERNYGQPDYYGGNRGNPQPYYGQGSSGMQRGEYGDRSGGQGGGGYGQSGMTRRKGPKNYQRSDERTARADRGSADG